MKFARRDLSVRVIGEDERPVRITSDPWREGRPRTTIAMTLQEAADVHTWLGEALEGVGAKPKDKADLVATLQQMITVEETEIDILARHATGMTADVAVSIRREFVTKLKALIH